MSVLNQRIKARRAAGSGDKTLLKAWFVSGSEET
jgi:hypothetical protein